MDAGVTVGIGTDGAASNNLLDVLAEVRLAALLAKVAGGGGTVAAEQALRMATIDAARALRRDHETGSVEPGKLADLTCIDLHRCNSQPVYEPVSQLVYATRADQVSDVWVAGRHLLDQGELTSINRESIFKRSSEWRQRIANSRK
jgi:5-methylthioadenosine/S-adenosylhomocysteine deaminase